MEIRANAFDAWGTLFDEERNSLEEAGILPPL